VSLHPLWASPPNRTATPVSMPVWSKNSCGFTRVVLQQSPEPFTTLKGACTLCVLAARRKEQHVALALMMPLMLNIRHMLRQRMAERRFPTGCDRSAALNCHLSVALCKTSQIAQQGEESSAPQCHSGISTLKCPEPRGAA